MGQTISWTEYFLTIGTATAAYYGWWWHRYIHGKGPGESEVERLAKKVSEERPVAGERWR